MLHREVQGEALTGETDGPAIEPRNQELGMPMLLSEAEGNTEHGAIRQSCSDPARSETLCTSGSPLHRNWEISAPGGAGKAKGRNPAAYAAEKSETSVVPEKPSNKGSGPAEMVEERDVAKGNTDRPPVPRTQSRISCASMGLEGVREAARRKRGLRKPETFDFLGFTHCCSVSRRGDFQVLRLTVKKRMHATLLAIRGELNTGVMNPSRFKGNGLPGW